MTENLVDVKDYTEVELYTPIEGRFLTEKRLRWKFFGDSTMVIEGSMRVNAWKRFWCWFFFGSTFEDVK